MRNIVLVCLILVGTLILLPSMHSIVNSTTINIDEQKVIYPLPYPGILTDHPLYSIKKMRDSILLFTTRDSIKKAELYHQLSDKRISTAIQLADKGKEELAMEELNNAEDYFLKVMPLLKESKQQGVSPSNDLIMKLYQSNAKHEEIITEVMKKLTQANMTTLNTLLEKNAKIRKQIGEI